MSDKFLRPRVPVNRRSRPPHPSPPPSPSPSFRRRTNPSLRRSLKPSKPIKILQRCKSEPTLQAGGEDGHRNMTPPGLGILRPHTFTDVFSSSPDLFAHSPRKFEGYNQDAKVVVNVTVEGSPGPVRTMVKLGSSVEETIGLVMKNYSKEGRSPRFHQNSTSTFELHHSYFSLQSLNKSDAIGDVGSRSFYLRKSNSGRNGNGEEIPSNSISDIVLVRQNTHIPFLPSFISRKINKIIRKTRKLWKIIGCMQGSG